MRGKRSFPFMNSGGEGGIRTLETLSGLHDFESCAIDHSATSPKGAESVPISLLTRHGLETEQTRSQCYFYTIHHSLDLGIPRRSPFLLCEHIQKQGSYLMSDDR